MKNLNQFVNECRWDIESLGIKVGNVTKITVNTRSKRRWGQCKRTPNGFEINISERLLNDDLDDWALKNTVAHELLHTIEGGNSHKGAWKMAAEKMNSLLGYNIKRCTSADEKGVESVPTIYRSKAPKYIIKCGNCGLEYKYYKDCKMINNFINRPSYVKKVCRCSKCKSHDLELLKNYKALGYTVL